VSVTFRLVLAIALIVGLISSGVVIQQYGSGSYFPGLVAGFAGTLVAFMLALTWERERDRRLVVREAAEVEQQRATEVRRRFEPIAVELEKNGESLAFLKDVYSAATDGTAAAAGFSPSQTRSYSMERGVPTRRGSPNSSRTTSSLPTSQLHTAALKNFGGVFGTAPNMRAGASTE
jgi:hypothetical protein